MAFEYERDEWRSAVRAMAPLEREAACTHDHHPTHRRSGIAVCIHCGHTISVGDL